MKKRIRVSSLFSKFLSVALLCYASAAFAAPAEILSMTRLLFVDGVSGLSQYTPKQGVRYAIGDICTIYIETTGFTLKPVNPNSDEEFEFDLAVDLAIRMPQRRRAIVSEKDFNTLKTTVRSKLPATFLAFGFAFDEEWEPGSYILELTLRDNLSEQSVTQEMTFQVEEPNEADRARQAEANNNRQAPEEE